MSRHANIFVGHICAGNLKKSINHQSSINVQSSNRQSSTAALTDDSKMEDQNEAKWLFGGRERIKNRKAKKKSRVSQNNPRPSDRSFFC
jgi:hypothetical protein